MARGKTTLYHQLGVPPTASQQEIRDAYRKRAKKAHPDAGGTPEEFRALAVAHEVLSNPETRSHYDETGEITEPMADQTDSHALGLIAQMMQGMLGGDPDPVTEPLVSLMVKHLEADMDKVRKHIANLKRGINRGERMRKRFKRKGGDGTNRMEALLETQLSTFKKMIEKSDLNLKVAARAVAILTEHTYEPEQIYKPQVTQQEAIYGQFQNLFWNNNTGSR